MRSEERGTRNKLLKRLAFAWLITLLVNGGAAAAPFSFDDIKYWVGTGTNRAALVIDWADYSTQPAALVWGYKWDGSKHGSDMLKAIVAADPRLFAKMSPSQSNPALYGLGYDANCNGAFGINDDTEFDSAGFAYSGPADLATATDAGDYYAEGWYTGFWHYGVALANPYNGGSWADTGVGMASRTLTDGGWDSWTFSPSFNFSSFAENPLAALPFQMSDFNHDGHVDAADFAVWRSHFGLSPESAGDANCDTVVDAADYVTWRHASDAAGLAAYAMPTNVPEPSTAALVALLLGAIVVRRRPLMNAAKR